MRPLVVLNLRGRRDHFRPVVATRPMLGIIPPVTPMVPTAEATMDWQDGLVPGTATKSIVTLAGGGALAAISSAFPDPFKYLAMIGGFGVAAFGGIGLYRNLSGSQEPTVEVRKTPPDQTQKDLLQLRGKILKPGKGSSAEITNNWKAIFTQSTKTFAIEFEIHNAGDKRLKFVAEFYHKEFSRVGTLETAEHSTTYLMDIGPGETASIKGFQPITGTFWGSDANASLLVRNSNAGENLTLATTSFTIGI